MSLKSETALDDMDVSAFEAFEFNRLEWRDMKDEAPRGASAEDS